MGLDIGKVEIERLPRPVGLAYQFAFELAEKATCWGDGNSVGWFERSDMEAKAKEFAKGNLLAEEILKDWIDTLPWGKDNCVILHFNW